ncbi:ribose-phosphate diphosphokinase [Candidatus Endomicrobiellum agilis]|uniref:ribose-phosphate diphosphokinase n=1 Tax=Candidatus Endomicrobiellum agilis TaxID=3238957 RepID=UPI00357F05CF|nr:ribose-phosphate pyrophosphokinase [Endomicrobium sp.]
MKLKIVSGNANLDLAKKITENIGVELSEAKVGRFSDGEIQVKIADNVRGADCFIIQPTCPSVNENLMELLVLADALKRASARRIIAVIPYYGYARQDRKSEPRVPITARLVANLLATAGVTRLLTMDLHADQIQGFFDIPVDHLYAKPILSKYFQDKDLKDVVVVSPDAGGADRARSFAKLIHAGLVIVDKRRPRPNEASIMNIIGEVKGKTCIIVDDLVDTAGTLTKVADAIKEKGAARVLAAATHGVLSGQSKQRVQNSALEELVITDTIPLSKEGPNEKIVVLSVGPILAEAIKRISNDESISALFL